MRFSHALGLLFFSLCWSSSSSAEVAENLGEFRISEFALSPQLRMSEPAQIGFAIQQTWLGFEWVKDPQVRGVLWLGSGELIQKPVWYAQEAVPDFGIVEAWVEGQSEYGDLRAGLLNVHQGFEGFYPEWSWRLPESRARRQGWLVKRDFAVQSRMRTGDFSTELTVYNGEAGSNRDGRMWVSGLWSYKNSDGWGGLLTASVGDTRPESTDGADAKKKEGFDFQVEDRAKIRYAVLSLFYDTERFLSLLEFGRGEILQNDLKSPYAWGRGDLAIGLSGDAFLLLRYEQNQARLNDPDSIVKAASLGVSFVARDKLQSVTLFATRNEEKVEIANNEVLLRFRLNSRYIP
jgi:hypothetical protein